MKKYDVNIENSRGIKWSATWLTNVPEKEVQQHIAKIHDQKNPINGPHFVSLEKEKGK